MAVLSLLLLSLLSGLTLATPIHPNSNHNHHPLSPRQHCNPPGNPYINPEDPGDTLDELLCLPCHHTTVIYARGTNQNGNIGGVWDVGRAFFNALAVTPQVGPPDRLAVQGVAYDASIGNFLNGGSDGGADKMRELAILAANKCPATRIVLGCFSQGCQVAHKAAKGADFPTGRIDAVVMFGDPNNGNPVGSVPPGKVVSICHSGDTICHGTLILPMPDHRNYQKDAEDAAARVAKLLG